VARLESFKTDIGVKMLEIDELKDNIYEKLPKELIQKIEELAEVNIKYKNIYKDVIEITTRRDFIVTKKTMDTTEYTNKLQILEEQLSNPVNIKTLKSDIKKIQDSAKNDHSVLNEINNCLLTK